MNTQLTPTSAPNFCDENGRAYLLLCPECKRENYAIAVSTGICCWCGYDLNEKGIAKNSNADIL